MKNEKKRIEMRHRIVKNDKKNRRKRISMTQDYDDIEYNKNNTYEKND